MKILSLNINNFGGCNEKKPRYSTPDYSTQINSFQTNPARLNTATKIIDNVFNCKDLVLGVIILHEFDINSPAGSLFLQVAQSKGYHAILPDGETASRSFKNASITVMFVRGEGKSINSPSGTKAWRWNQIDLKEFRLVGLHLPYDVDFGEAIEREFQGNAGMNVLYIGDWNAEKNAKCAGARANYEVISRLCTLGASDLGQEKNEPTFVGGTRIDYAITSTSLTSQMNCILTTDDRFISGGLSDHAAIIVDISAK